MKKFHLMHYVPNFTHGTHGYKEVIDTIKWGLEQLGHEVSYAVNNYFQGYTNIVFGAQMLPIEVMKNFAEDTIIYNMEQMRGFSPADIRPEVQFYAKHFEVWEYSRENLAAWASIGKTVNFVPVGYAPVLTRITKPIEQDIDVLIYGAPGETRFRVFDLLATANLKTMFVCGFYGESRDSLIARSKVIVNVGIYDSQIFEVVRVSYLLANKKAVIAVLDKNTVVEDDIKTCVKFTTFENLVADTCQLIENEASRVHFENSGFDVFSRRDMCDILRNVVS